MSSIINRCLTLRHSAICNYPSNTSIPKPAQLVHTVTGLERYLSGRHATKKIVQK